MIMCLWASHEGKIWGIFFASLKSLKKGVGSEVGSGSVSQRCGSGWVPHQNVTDPQHCLDQWDFGGVELLDLHIFGRRSNIGLVWLRNEVGFKDGLFPLVSLEVLADRDARGFRSRRNLQVANAVLRVPYKSDPRPWRRHCVAM